MDLFWKKSFLICAFTSVHIVAQTRQLEKLLTHLKSYYLPKKKDRSEFRFGCLTDAFVSNIAYFLNIFASDSVPMLSLRLLNCSCTCCPQVRAS